MKKHIAGCAALISIHLVLCPSAYPGINFAGLSGRLEKSYDLDDKRDYLDTLLELQKTVRDLREESSVGAYFQAWSRPVDYKERK